MRENRKELVIALWFCVLLILIRAPYLFLDARFWAEEGCVYFKYAYKNGIKILYWMDDTGYFYLFANLAAWIATMVPLAVAPYITTVLAFFVQVMLLVAILFLPSKLFTSVYSKIIASIFTVLGPCIVSEVWLNTINSQVFFGLIGICVLFSDNIQLKKKEFCAWMIILVIASLSGAYCFVLVPFFVIKYYLGNKKAKVEMIIMIITATIQGGGILAFKFWGYTNSKRTFSLGDKNIVDVFLYQLIRPLFGYENMKKMVGGNMSLYCLFGIIFIGVMVIWTFMKSANRMNKYCIVAIICLYVYYMIYTTMTAISAPGMRYAVVPGTLLNWLIISCVDYTSNLLQSNLFKRIVLCIAMIPLIYGIIDFQGDKNTYLSTKEQPSWKNQIERLKESGADIENAEIKIWPAGWTVQLK